MKFTMILLTIIVYLGYVIYIGVKCSKQNKNSDDFYLGGRKLGPFVTAMSAEASDMSSWLLMGLPGVALMCGVAGNTSGFAEAVWTAIGLALGTYINWLIVAKRIRIYSEKTNSNTIPDFFADRYKDRKGITLAIAAIIIIIFFIPYTGSGFAAVGKLFNSLFGMDYHVALIIGAACIACYTILGGFLAASTTDFTQSIIMTIALFVIVFFGFENAGSANEIANSLRANVPNLKNYFSLTGVDGSYGFLAIVSTLAWGLGYFGMPHILLRFMAIDNPNNLKLSRRVASVWVTISMGIAILIGIIGYSFAVNNGLMGENFDSERIIIYISDAIANLDTFAAIIAGIILSGILASIMSTADSQMLAAASSVSENIVKRFMWKNMSEKTQMWIARISVAVISVVGVIMAWNPNSSVFRIVSFAWAGFGATFGPVVLAALFWKRSNLYGAIAGMVSGASMVFIWKFLIKPMGGIFGIYELLPAFIVSSIFIVVVSLITKKPEQRIIDEFEAVEEEMKASKDAISYKA